MCLLGDTPELPVSRSLIYTEMPLCHREYRLLFVWNARICAEWKARYTRDPFKPAENGTKALWLNFQNAEWRSPTLHPSRHDFLDRG